MGGVTEVVTCLFALFPCLLETAPKVLGNQLKVTKCTAVPIIQLFSYYWMLSYNSSPCCHSSFVVCDDVIAHAMVDVYEVV